ncbi:hypothetical protein [Frigoribacterium sp. NPDC087798]|uniref:hypothetical protein n=1 Tax=Frigoribacterium sp. NPDC087798 TaxID=3363993 RepID=UPI00380D35F9
MYLGVRPEGVLLTAPQAKILDDEFYLSDPLSHFSSRIAMLLASKDHVVPPTTPTQPGFFRALGLSGVDALPPISQTGHRVQVALDALALRHQCAEAVERFLYAVTAESAASDAACMWLAVAESPPRTIDVLKATKARFDADQQLLLRLMFPAGTPITDDVLASARTALEWINHASYLLTDDELSINAAHNKLKHGLAVAARDDVRIELVTIGPNENGEVPLSAFGEGESVPIFDRPLLTYLSRPHARPKQGLEAVSLRVDLDTVLAETWMMATVYAALFHVAARNHFGEDLPDGVAPFPTLVIGRTPDRVLGGKPLATGHP